MRMNEAIKSDRPLALIDGDVLMYRTLWRLSDGSPHDVIDVGTEMMIELDRWLDAVHEGWREGVIPVILSSADPTFRHIVWPKYKQNRVLARAPIFKDYGKWFLRQMDEVDDSIVCMEKPLLEADDLIGILGTHPKLEGRCIIVSVDKDLKQIPGEHYNPVKDIFSEVSPEDAQYLLHLQWLMGDSTDNIPGLPGIGPKKAEKLLYGLFPEEWPEAIHEKYEEVYQDQGSMCMIMRALVEILPYGYYIGDGWYRTAACSVLSR